MRHGHNLESGGRRWRGRSGGTPDRQPPLSRVRLRRVPSESVRLVRPFVSGYDAPPMVLFLRRTEAKERAADDRDRDMKPASEPSLASAEPERDRPTAGSHPCIYLSQAPRLHRTLVVVLLTEVLVLKAVTVCTVGWAADTGGFLVRRLRASEWRRRASAQEKSCSRAHCACHTVL